jgi:hypothetical protein
MSRRRSARPFTATAHPVIRAKANALCAEHRLDAARAFRIIERGAQRYGRQVLATNPEEPVDRAIGVHGLVFIEELREALQYHSPDDVLRIFECSDAALDRMGFRVRLTHDLGDKDGPLPPLYTLAELQEHTAAFIEHLGRDRESLLKCGIPSVAFSRSHVPTT